MFWSVPDFKRIRTWATGGGRINSVAYSADGRRVVSAAAQKVQVWDIATGAVLLTVPPRAGDSMTCAALSPDGARLAVASYKTGGRSDEGSDQVWVVDATTGERIYTVSGHPYSANYVRFSPDGQWLLTGTYGATEVDTDVSIRIWDAATGTRLAGSVPSMNWPWHASFSPDNTKMLVLGLSLEPVLWDLVEQREVYRLKGAGAFQVLFHPNGERFVVIDGNGVRIHAVSDGRELVTLDRGHVSLIDPPGGGIPAAFTPDGRELICRRDGSTMIRFKTADWTTPDRKTEFAQGLDEVRRLLALPK
ncbi:MAG: PD40 domain-containing protein [Candidatus Hydrogenedentes bacterium]|nr:PD40 domain-containing protein [Candidatus Hydrogenedentota bacterium]